MAAITEDQVRTAQAALASDTATSAALTALWNDRASWWDSCTTWSQLSAWSAGASDPDVRRAFAGQQGEEEQGEEELEEGPAALEALLAAAGWGSPSDDDTEFYKGFQALAGAVHGRPAVIDLGQAWGAAWAGWWGRVAQAAGSQDPPEWAYQYSPDAEPRPDSGRWTAEPPAPDPDADADAPPAQEAAPASGQEGPTVTVEGPAEFLKPEAPGEGVPTVYYVLQTVHGPEPGRAVKAYWYATCTEKPPVPALTADHLKARKAGRWRNNEPGNYSRYRAALGDAAADGTRRKAVVAWGKKEGRWLTSPASDTTDFEDPARWSELPPAEAAETAAPAPAAGTAGAPAAPAQAFSGEEAAAVDRLAEMMGNDSRLLTASDAEVRRIWNEHTGPAAPPADRAHERGE